MIRSSMALLCGKVPRGGDGSLACTLPRGHQGSHSDDHGATTWRNVEWERERRTGSRRTRPTVHKVTQTPAKGNRTADRDRRAGGARGAALDQAARAAVMSLLESASNRVNWYKSRSRGAGRPWTPNRHAALGALALAVTLGELANGRSPSSPEGIDMLCRLMRKEVR